METLRKVVAALVGIIVIIGLILLAKWLGDQIRARIFPTKSETANVTTVTTNVAKPAPTRTRPAPVTTKTATLSAIPETGPLDVIYPVLALLAAAGASVKFVSNKALR